MATKYGSVSEMVKDLTDEEFYNNFQQTLTRTSLSRVLIAMRNKEGVTQKEMAAKMGCSQGKISKIENADNDDIKMGDLLAYAKALGLSLDLRFANNMNAANAVMFHASMMKRNLDLLAELAHKDDIIHSNVLKTFNDIIDVVHGVLWDSVSKLPELQEGEKPASLAVHSPFDFSEAIKEETGEKISTR